MINTLFKEHYYIFYITNDEEIFVEVTVNLLIKEIFKIHKLLSFIVNFNM